MVRHDPEHHRKTCTKFFFCVVFITLIHIVLLLTILQAILHVRHPKTRISQVTIQDLHFNSSSQPSATMKLVTQVTIHNPTLCNFRFQNGSLVFLYRETQISSGLVTRVPVKGRSNKMLSVDTSLNSTSVLTQKDIRIFSDDIDSGVLPLSARIKFDGEIQLMKVIKRKAIMETHCDMVVNLVLEDTQSIKCNWYHVN